MHPWLEIVAPIAQKAGRMARRRLLSAQPVPARRKDSGGWVTELDETMEAFIMEELQHYFPDHGVLGEESGLQGSTEECWVIDPLDGTTNFIHGFSHCAVSIAYCQNGRSMLGVIYDIGTDDLYQTAIGEGAYLNGERIRVSKPKSFSQSLFLASGQISADGDDLFSLYDNLADRTDGMRRLGATVLDLAWLAGGRVDAIVSGPVQFWDVAAGSLLVREAGGLLSDINDKTDFAFNEKTAWFVAGAVSVFPRFLNETKIFYNASH